MSAYSGNPHSGSHPTTEPLVLEKQQIAGAIEIHFEIPGDLIFCEGHFPANPIVPGFVLVRWAITWSQALLPSGQHGMRFPGIKFKQAVLPGKRYRFRAHWNSQKKLLQIGYFDQLGTEVASCQTLLTLS